MTDRDMQAAAERAARELETRIRPVCNLAAPEEWARRFIADLMAGADRWRPIPEPPPLRHTGHPSGPTADYLARRQALREDTP